MKCIMEKGIFISSINKNERNQVFLYFVLNILIITYIYIYNPKYVLF